MEGGGGRGVKKCPTQQTKIKPSEELHSAFKKLLTSPGQRGLLCTIVNEVIEPSAILEPATSSFDNDLFTLLEPHLLENENAAFYIILRRDHLSSTAPFVAITYVPDSAPVRSKMLYASTRLTLVRELGTERFHETIFATTRQELTAEGFKKHDQHIQLDAPLTKEEKFLDEIKRQEAMEIHSIIERKNDVTTSYNIPVSDEVIKSLIEMKNSDNEGITNENAYLIQLKINVQTERLELDSKTITPINELGKSISNTMPRFSFYRYFHTHNGVTSSPILFIYTCPSDSRPKERMLYATSSRSVRQLAKETAGLNIIKSIEENDPATITVESINADLYPPTPMLTKNFGRPRRPGRGPSKINNRVGHN
ncbi:Twinfilin [Erysiphe neolycopersici]|uniref:Twinfilin n=1 Tax=Erysiphe neolycopersici TaxID=212602 RepID=A0A420HQ06_9PEZI|nr:Twinfilin [Erysiphe neolycopersici]